MRTKAESEPKKLHKTNKSPKDWKDTLEEQQQKRISRRESLNKQFNKIVKDRF